ncbi:hypothetical protein B5F23_03190 [Olsenella sp. An188]|nr:hypothetical protein B5F23_03190 [Olsenella sp. An188]
MTRKHDQSHYLVGKGRGDMLAIFNERTKWALRARLLEIGWEHLLRKGFRALRIEDITQEAGIGKGTFYGFFPSKDDFV